MLEFMKENFLCSSGDSPRLSGRASVRPGEVISSTRPQQEVVIQHSLAVPWDARHADTRLAMTSGTRSPIRTGSPVVSRQSFREVLGGSIAYTGAAFAQGDELLPGHGLYVPMQSGLGRRSKRTSRNAAAGHLAARSPRAAAPAAPRAMTPPRTHHREASPPRTPSSPVTPCMVRAMPDRGFCWQPGVESHTDQIVEACIKQHASANFLVRKLATNEYEVDGYRVQVGFRDGEPFAFMLGAGTAGGADEALGPGEPLRNLLQRASGAAAAREATLSRGPSAVAAPGGQAERRREVHSVRAAPGSAGGSLVTCAAAGPPGSAGGSLVTCEGGSFIIPRDGGGSFYSVAAPVAAPPKDPFAKPRGSAAAVRLLPAPMRGVQQACPAAGARARTRYRPAAPPPEAAAGAGAGGNPASPAAGAKGGGGGCAAPPPPPQQM